MDEDEQKELKHQWCWSSRGHPRAVLDDNKLTVTFHRHQQSLCCAAIRGTKPLKANMEHYFEIEIGGPMHGQAKMVGLGTKHTPFHAALMDYYPILGRDGGSWGLNYDGMLYHNGEAKKYISTIPTKGAEPERLVFGVYYDAYYGLLSFEVDGIPCGLAYEGIPPNLEPYPMVCASASNSSFTLLFSHSSVLSLKALCRGVIRMEMKDSDGIDKLPLPTHVRAFVGFNSEWTLPVSRIRRYKGTS